MPERIKKITGKNGGSLSDGEQGELKKKLFLGKKGF